MHIASRLEEDVTEMTIGHQTTHVSSHKEEKKEMIADNEDHRQKIHERGQRHLQCQPDIFQDTWT